MKGQRKRIKEADASASSGLPSGPTPLVGGDGRFWQLPHSLLELWALGRMSPQTLQQVQGLYVCGCEGV